MGGASQRAAGILLAVSSLPSPYGIGSFGAAARNWIDFLKDAGQKYWQILPLGPTGWGDSPYQSFSAFALSPYYIDPDTLIDEGLLQREEIQGIVWGADPARVDYAALYRHREGILRRAFSRFKGGAAYDAFRAKHAGWLPDYALFMAIKQNRSGDSWLGWNKPLRFRESAVLDKCRETYADDIAYHYFVQYTAYTQWMAIRKYAADAGVAVIGDMPVYVSMDSADIWANSGMFQLDRKRNPLEVAGCPPDPFAAKGQLWGNPLYHWDKLEEAGFDWWIARLRLNMELFDVVRIDHFRGFESYYSIPAGDSDASRGKWVKGPGIAFINAVRKALPEARIIAEDLGYLTAEVKALLEVSGFPGMKVLQFAFDSRESGGYMPYTYPRNCVVYTGTHDNPTSLGWFYDAKARDIALAKDYLGLSDVRDGHLAYIRTALSSVANLAVIPMQDYLGLDNSARMNTPSTTGGGNWEWRMDAAARTPALAGYIRRMTEITGRV
jgi:4-alpha-glucanotransferase